MNIPLVEAHPGTRISARARVLRAGKGLVGMKIGKKVSEAQKKKPYIGLLLSQSLHTGPCGPHCAFCIIPRVLGSHGKFVSRAADSDKVQFTVYEAHSD